MVINDPSVRTMNDAQWMFEYHAMIEKEKQQAEIVGDLMAAGRKMMISALGLDVVGKLAGIPDDEEYLIPLGLMTASPEILHGLIEHAESEAGAIESEADDDFDALSRHLMEATAPDADGDIQPIPFAEPLEVDEHIRQNAYAYSEEYAQALNAFVKPRKRVSVDD